MLKLTMEARRTDLLHILSSEHKGYTKATQARSQVLLPAAHCGLQHGESSGTV